MWTSLIKESPLSTRQAQALAAAASASGTAAAAAARAGGTSPSPEKVAEVAGKAATGHVEPVTVVGDQWLFGLGKLGKSWVRMM